MASTFEYVHWILRSRLDTREKLVLAVLCDHRNNQSGQCFVSYKTLCDETGYCLQTLMKSISALTAADWQPPLLQVHAPGSEENPRACNAYSFPLWEELAKYRKKYQEEHGEPYPSKSLYEALTDIRIGGARKIKKQFPKPAQSKQAGAVQHESEPVSTL